MWFVSTILTVELVWGTGMGNLMSAVGVCCLDSAGPFLPSPRSFTSSGLAKGSWEHLSGSSAGVRGED